MDTLEIIIFFWISFFFCFYNLFDIYVRYIYILKNYEYLKKRYFYMEIAYEDVFLNIDILKWRPI